MTLKDVATISGCSVATVCKVFKDSAEISDETKKAVLSAAKKCGYFDKAASRTAVYGGIKTIIFADPAQKYQAEFSAISAAFVKGGFQPVYLIASAKTATEMAKQIGAVALLFMGEYKSNEPFIFAFEIFEISQVGKLLKEFETLRPERASRGKKSGTAAARRAKTNAPKGKAKKPAAPSNETGISNSQKPAPARAKQEEIWLL